MREPTIAWWPGTVEPGSVCTELACTMDIFATCLDLAGVPLPSDRIIDGVSLVPVLKGTGKSGRDVMFFYRGIRLMAVRKGPWKAHFITQAGYRQKPQKHDPPLLFHLDRDPSEQYDVAKANRKVIADIQAIVAEHQAKLKAPPSQLDRVRPGGRR